MPARTARDAAPDDEWSTSSPGATGEPICDRFAGTVEGAGPIWTEGATLGFDAGGLKCAALGADHVCTYTELVEARANGELSPLRVGTTLWVHRLVPVTKDDVFYPAELGGRCVTWSCGANELADGEYMEVTVDGVEFHLEEDTFCDGIDTSHAAPGLFQCGGEVRAIPCCHPDC